MFERRQPKIHDYTIARRGHDGVFTAKEGTEGHEGSGRGWGEGIAVGDFLLFAGPNGGSSPYRVTKITYYRDPPDMWAAELVYDAKWK